MADIYSPKELLLAELTLREQQGFEPEAIAHIHQQVAATAAGKPDVDEIWQEIANLAPPGPAWKYYEPDALNEIRATLPPSPPRITHHALRITEKDEIQATRPPSPPLATDNRIAERIHGGLLGRFAGCMLGKPLEIPWPAATIRRYLELAGAYPLDDYVPLLEPFPDDFPRPPWGRWQETTRGNISRVVQDDDVEYTLAAYLILKQHGFDFTTENVGAFWLRHFAYEQVHTAERLAYRNLINGISPPQTALFRNPYREWIGAQIRADVYGYVSPGQPRRAAELAWRDARLSHTGNGIYGAMWVAAMVAAAFALDEPEAIIQAGLAQIPPQSRLAEAVGNVMAWSHQSPTWEATFTRIDETVGRAYRAAEKVNWVHVIPNACLVAMGLMHGGGDFSRSITTAVMGGWDTDCNGATVGSIVGVMLGAQQLPRRWVAPLNDRIQSYIPDCDGRRISALAGDIAALANENGQ